METQRPPPLPSETKKAAWAILGAVVGAVASTVIVLINHYGGPTSEGLGILSAIVNSVVLLVTPLIAIGLTLPKRTRAFGLGLLVACGVCWLVELSVCGGASAVTRAMG